MIEQNKIWFASADEKLYLLGKMANRHGLIAGATGTGKTVTLKVLAESFSDMGVPVFLADVKGDLSGMCEPGVDSADMQKRITKFGIDNFTYKSYPARYWDIYGEVGQPVRVTISDMGPVLLARLLGLTDAQEGVLNIAFRVADDNGLLLLDMKDLRALLQFLGDNRTALTTQYGNVSTASIGAIQRALLAFENESGQFFFGEPALEITDWIRTDTTGRGYINILNSTKLISNPLTYSTFLLWMLTALYEKLPEVGDLEKPRIVFFFDEAHLLFNDAPKALMNKLVQIVKLIRSKGVGAYFISQSPSDIPNEVLAQLSNRIQHALRAYTPAEMKAIKATAEAFRENPDFDSATVLQELGVGEALVSCLDEKGIPTIVQRAKILPPQSKMGPADETKLQTIIKSDEFEFKYRNPIDRESAYEILMAAQAQINEIEEEEEEVVEEAPATKSRLTKVDRTAKETAPAKAKTTKTTTASSKKSKALEQAATIATTTLATAVTRNLVNAATGGKKTDAKTIAKRAATNALSSVARSESKALIRGLFGNLK